MILTTLTLSLHAQAIDSFVLVFVGRVQAAGRKALPYGGLRFADPPYKKACAPFFGTIRDQSITTRQKMRGYRFL
jgi:hypothetical protein